MRPEQAQALHELFLLSASTGRYAEADRQAVAAFEAYGSHTERLGRLARDLVRVWTRQGRAGHAAPLLAALGASEFAGIPLATPPPPLDEVAERTATSLADSLARVIAQGGDGRTSPAPSASSAPETDSK
jgi:hypothetical protein